MAVVGAVKNPGLVILTGAGETILDVITQAGGMTPDAADEIVIMPEVKGGQQQLQQIADRWPRAVPPNRGPMRRRMRQRKLDPRKACRRLPRQCRTARSISRRWNGK